MHYKSIIYGFIGAVLLLAVYFFVVGFISGLPFALNQFEQFWYFIVSLALGFGIQIGLYSHLKITINQRSNSPTGTQDGASGQVLAVSGTTSTAAMVSCCTHYLANILPIIGTAGIISIIGQYQTEIFWIGLAFNIAGIVYISRKVIQFYQL